MSSPYYTVGRSSTEIIPTIIAAILFAITWFWMWWHIVSKAGHRGRVRWAMVIGMCIPYINAFCMFFILLMPWPVHQEVKEHRRKLGIPPEPPLWKKVQQWFAKQFS